MTRWTEQQLDLYKSKRQRGTKLPPVPEFHLHVMVADVLARWCSPEWRYTHVPLGEYRPKATAGRLKRMGVLSGFPDFQFFHCRGAVCFLELKRKGERPTEAQKAIAFFVINAGHGYLCTDSFDDALNALRAWGIVPSRISTLNSNPESRERPCPSPEERAIA